MKHVPSCMAWLVLAALALMMASGILNGIADWTLGKDAVTLHAPTWGDGKVYLFDELREGPDVQYAAFPSGTRCTRHDPTLYRLGEGSTALFFYQLECKGVTGYVNRQWVR